MNLAELLDQHAKSMHAITAANVVEVQATSAKLRECIGDPYAAYRFNRSLGEADETTSAPGTADPAGTQPLGGAS